MASQYGQDRFVITTLGGVRGGFFLDSGASDGVSVSNTLALERDFGWDGICVEPNDLMFEQLVRNRRCRCVNCCLYDRPGDVAFVERAQTLGGILAEYHPAPPALRDRDVRPANECGRNARDREEAGTTRTRHPA